MTSAMTKCIKEKVSFQPCQGKIVEAEFVEKEVSSEGGVLLLREIDRKIKLTSRLAEMIPDPRHQHRIVHSLLSMLQQRIYAIALARIFHERRGGNLNNPIKFKCLNKNQDDFRHDKVYQGKSIVPTLPRQNCGGRICERRSQQ
jgi:hypothetical protein